MTEQEEAERAHCLEVAAQITGCGEQCVNEIDGDPGESWCCAHVATIIARERADARRQALEEAFSLRRGCWRPLGHRSPRPDATAPCRPAA